MSGNDESINNLVCFHALANSMIRRCMIRRCIVFGYIKIVSEYDQEIPQSQTADNPVAL